MPTKREFIQRSKELGKTKEETLSKMDELDAKGFFGEESVVPLEKEPGFLDRLKSGKDRTLFGVPPKVEEALFPRTAKLTGEQKESGRGLASGVSDILSIPGRAVAALPSLTPGGETFGESFSRPKGKEGTGISGMGGTLLRDPANIPAVLSGGSSKGIQAGAKLLPKIGRGLALGAREGAVSAGVHQLENVAEGKDVSLKEAVVETSIGGVGGAGLAGAATPISKGIQGATRLANRTLGRMAEGLSGVSEDVLRMFGTGKGTGAATLRQAKGTQIKVANKILDGLDNIDDVLPEKEIVKDALSNMPEININNAIASLEKAKPLGKVGAAKAVPGKIDGVIKDLRAAAEPDFIKVPGVQGVRGPKQTPNPKAGTIPAEKFRRLRTEIDGLIGDFGADESSALTGALKQARRTMAKDLRESAVKSGNDQYVQAMDEYARKLGIVDELKGYIGRSKEARSRKIESFTSNVFNKNKTHAQQTLADLGDVLGEDFIKQAKLAQMADVLTDAGELPFAPTSMTGKAGLGAQVATAVGAGNLLGPLSPVVAIPTLATTFPKTAAPTLAAATAIEKATPKILSKIGTPIKTGARVGLRSMTREQQQKLAASRRGK